MKRMILIISILIVAVLCSCCANQHKTKETEHTEYTCHQKAIISPNETSKNWNLYQITDSTPAFSTVMNENPIDFAYNAEIDTAGTTSEFVEIEKKYVTIWLDEMNASIECFLTVLTDEDAKYFMEIQEEWFNATNAELQATNDLLRGKTYELQLGQGFSQLLLSEKRNIYRERTIKIKYLHYLLETLSCTQATQLQSTIFYYKAEDCSQ